MVMTVTVDESSPLLSVNINVRGAAPTSSRATDGEAVAHAEHVESRTEHAADDDDEEAPRHNNDGNNNNNDNDNDNNNNNNDNNNNNNDPNNDDNGSQFLNRTRQRLRCLFVMFTCPIIPLVTALSMFLLWVLYAAFVDEDSSNCTKPLRTYAWMSMLLFMYTPNHRRVKRFLSSRHNSSNETNAAVDRMYDHLYITCCLFYLYVGVTWTNTCCEGGGGLGGLDQTRNKGGGAGAESCYCGCRSLYYATHSFVLTLCVLATVLALPLLCLPCVYLWIVRGATEDALMDAYANHGVGGVGEAANALSDWSVGQVLDQMDRVTNAINMSTGSLSTQSRLGSLLSSSIKSSMDKLNQLIWQPDVECCICMNQLNDENNGPIVRTKCGHLFHRKCLGSWLAGQQWDEENASASAGSAPNTTRAVARRLCPLCREDLIPASCPLASSSASQQQQYQRADSFVADSAGIVF